MADVIRLGPTTVTVEETPNQVTVSDETPNTVTVNSPYLVRQDISQLVNFTLSNLLTVTTGKTKFVFPVDAVLLGATCSVNTAPVGADIIVDVNVDGVSVYDPANRPKIVDGSVTGSEATTFLDATVSAGSYVTVDVDQVGSTTPGDYLNVTIRFAIV